MRRYYNQYDKVLGTSFYVYMYMFGCPRQMGTYKFFNGIFFPKKKFKSSKIK
jgi:hypothetical protein